MKYLVLFGLFASFPASLFAERVKIDLPEWKDASESESYQLGGGLWPEGLFGESADAAGGAGEAGAISNANLTFFGPNGAESDEPIRANVTETAAPVGSPDGVPEVVVEAPAVEALPPIEGDLADLYFGYRPVDYLVDPQRLLTEQKSNDIKRFLEFHSDESEFEIYTLVVGETQEIPSDVNLRELHQEWFGDSPTVIMVYYRENPEKTEFVFNEKIRTALPSSVFEKIRKNTLREGGVTDLAPDQVEKMAIELSIQLYWLSQTMKLDNKQEQERFAATPTHEMTPTGDAPELLREYAPGIFIQKKSIKWISILITLLIVIGVILLMAGIGWVVMWWRAQDRVGGGPLIFPAMELVPRLGGEYSGGGFVSMSFDIREGSNLVD